jgi:glycosyltransferase involved in cell wall biosynthesis
MISTTIIVKNGARHLNNVLKALEWCDEIVLYDTGSTDTTLQIAKNYPNVSVYQKAFIGFGPCHNEASRLAKHDWILSIDADEVMSENLIQEIQSLSLNPQTVYSLSRHNYYNGKHIKWCGWHPEACVRLYNRKTTCFSEALVHEGVISKGLQIIYLNHPLFHYPYESLSDFLVKMERYSSLFAEQYHQKRVASPWTAILHGLAAFCKSFFIKKGFLGGYEGFLISAYNGHTAFYKYLKLYQANQKSSPKCF